MNMENNNCERDRKDLFSRSGFGGRPVREPCLEKRVGDLAPTQRSPNHLRTASNANSAVATSHPDLLTRGSRDDSQRHSKYRTVGPCDHFIGSGPRQVRCDSSFHAPKVMQAHYDEIRSLACSVLQNQFRAWSKINNYCWLLGQTRRLIGHKFTEKL